MMTEQEIAEFVAEARRYVQLAVRFRHQGRTVRGVDCAGLVYVSLVAAGHDPIDCPAYGREPFEQGLRGYLVRNFGEPIPKDEMRQGDVVLMRFKGEPCHVAIIADYIHGGLSLIHSYATVRKCVEHRIDAEWDGYIVEVFRP
jgi:cell wall-associated NlpC family hydrolase